MNRDKMCRSKKSFFTRGEAQHIAKKHDGLRVYECPFCFCFHLTSKPERITVRDKLIAEKRRIESLMGNATAEEKASLKMELSNIENILATLKSGPKVPARDTSNDIFFQILAELRTIRTLLSENNSRNSDWEQGVQSGEGGL